MASLLKAFISLAPLVKELVVAIVREIKGSPDPEKAAKRALDEVRLVKLFDERMKRRP